MGNKRKPTCYIIAGPNGAGKTTFALQYLPEIAGCRNFVNADFLAYGLSPFDSVSAQLEAGRLFLREIQANIDKRKDFAFETTLAGRSQITLIKKLKEGNWNIILFFLWIPDAVFSRNRIRERVRQGGHDIPDETIIRRYPRVMYNFIKIYIPLCDKIFCYDNSGSEPIIVFVKDKNGQKISNNDIFESIVEYSNGYKRNP
jgi:predicted ABC-type ATPase